MIGFDGGQRTASVDQAAPASVEIRCEGRVPYELSSGSRFLIEADAYTSVEYRHGDRGGGR